MLDELTPIASVAPSIVVRRPPLGLDMVRLNSGYLSIVRISHSSSSNFLRQKYPTAHHEDPLTQRA